MQAIFLLNGNLYIARYLNKLLQLESISLVQFKNYSEGRFPFRERIIGICGKNGVGKTNLLDAIYYLCFTKSYFNRLDSQNSTTGTTGFRIEGSFRENHQAVTAVCILREAGRKEFIVGDSPYERFAQHIGRFPCVMIAPDDIQIISSGSEERRRFIDALMSQLDPEYLRRLINYNKILQQRNSCLKSMAENRIRDLQLLTVYDEQLVPEGEFIHQRRKDFLAACLDLAKTFYRQISAGEEEVDLVYQSQLSSTEFRNLLEGSREKDLHLQRTNTGIHKDDLVLTLNGEPFRLMASQGQRKSLLFALKLAEFESLRTTKGFAPLLLLDDVFEKLDEGRMHNLLDQVCVNNGGQIFITDTHQSRIEEHFSRLGLSFQLINL